MLWMKHIIGIRCKEKTVSIMKVKRFLKKRKVCNIFGGMILLCTLCLSGRMTYFYDSMAATSNTLQEEKNALTILDCMAQSSQSKQEIPELHLYAKAAVLMDADSGRILYDKNGEEQLPMASTTKIMTLIVTLENGELDDVVEVSSYAASMPEVKLHIRTGEEYKLKDLLYSLMLESHNDSAVAIAEHVGGSVEQFAALMNEKAVEIGCENTCFITPNGLDATAEFTTEDNRKVTKTHSTTAADLARILSYCITKSPCRDKFLEITRTPSYSFQNMKKTRSFSCTNHNAFLSMMSGALTGKTGFTGNAGYCYAGALKRDERTFVVALLGCGWPNHKTYKWSDTRTLMEYGIEHFAYHSFAEASIPKEALEPILVKDAKTNRIGEEAYIGVTALEDSAKGMECEGVLMRENEQFTVSMEKKDSLMAPVEQGTEIGTLTFWIGTEEWKKIKLVTTEEMERIDMAWCISQVFQCWMLN